MVYLKIVDVLFHLTCFLNSKRGKNNTSAGRVVKKAKTNNNAKTTKPKALENKHKKTILRVLEEKGIQYCIDKYTDITNQLNGDNIDERSVLDLIEKYNNII